jgi:hypothetical protein
MKRLIPYAVANYEKLVREYYHFVDKTRFIRDLELYQHRSCCGPAASARACGAPYWSAITT